MRFYLFFIATLVTLSCSQKPNEANEETTTADTLRYADEKHLKNIKQLTFGGDNAEAYWSFNSSLLTFQSTSKIFGTECDQIFYLNPFQETKQGFKPQMISTGKGRTTCSYFLPGDTTVVYASTHLGNEACPPVPDLLRWQSEPRRGP